MMRIRQKGEARVMLLEMEEIEAQGATDNEDGGVKPESRQKTQTQRRRQQR